jgi:hypothetical protein
MHLPTLNTTYRFSYYKNLYSVEIPDGEMNINDIIEIVKYGYLNTEIKKLRLLDGEKYNAEKKKLPAITLSGIFSKRTSENIISHSGLIQVDIDNVQDYEEAFYTICNNEFTYVCFRSPGGKGIKVIVKIPPTIATHKQQFNALERYYKNEFNIVIDPNCSNISRCLLLSHDPNLYCNPFSTQFEEVYSAPEFKISTVEESKSTYYTSFYSPTVMIEDLINEIQSKKIDITLTYSDWIRIGFALCTTFEENGRKYFHQISQFYPKYKFTETEKTYTGLLKRNNGNTKFGSILFIANSHGIRTKK